MIDYIVNVNVADKFTDITSTFVLNLLLFLSACLSLKKRHAEEKI